MKHKVSDLVGMNVVVELLNYIPVIFVSLCLSYPHRKWSDRQLQYEVSFL